MIREQWHTKPFRCSFFSSHFGSLALVLSVTVCDCVFENKVFATHSKKRIEYLAEKLDACNL